MVFCVTGRHVRPLHHSTKINQRMLSSVLYLSATVTPYAVSDAAGFEPTPFLFKKKLEVTLNFTTDLCSGGRTRTCDLKVMSLASYLCYYPAMFVLSRKDSNLNSLDQNQMCCRYTTGQFAISNMSKNDTRCY